MRLLEYDDAGSLRLNKPIVGDKFPRYAILSHTWGEEDDEVNFTDITTGEGTMKPGFQKIRFCGERAKQDGLRYFWVDTCCIDKANNTELSEAINSMFRWYSNSTKCYAYLSDILQPDLVTNESIVHKACDEFKKSR